MHFCCEAREDIEKESFFTVVVVLVCQSYFFCIQNNVTERKDKPSLAVHIYLNLLYRELYWLL
jgi:hypothetical protein